jgi:hypothetical protein
MTNFDISETLAPKSDQLDGIDLVDGPRDFTVTEVSRGNAEQPVQVHLAEFPRVWRPGKNMRRILAYCWGKDAATWAGKRVRLYYDPEVRFGNEKPGGTRVSHLSDIDGPRDAPIMLTRGKAGTWHVDPLPDLSPVDKLRAEWKTATPERRAEIEAEVARLTKGADQ